MYGYEKLPEYDSKVYQHLVDVLHIPEPWAARMAVRQLPSIRLPPDVPEAMVTMGMWIVAPEGNEFWMKLYKAVVDDPTVLMMLDPVIIAPPEMFSTYPKEESNEPS